MKLSDQVYSQLKQSIFEAQFHPNELITERQIAEQYGVSKLTAGEVLHRLCAEGHLTSFPRSGYMVTSLTPAELAQLQQLREVVESFAVELVCKDVSDERIHTLWEDIVPYDEIDNISKVNLKFHMDLVRLTDNKFIINIMEILLGTMCRVQPQGNGMSQPTWQERHAHLITALEKHDLKEARRQLTLDITEHN